jgi:hypothetical protein
MAVWTDKFNLKQYILDPFSVIVKLAVLSKKPVGTKILIQDNCIYFQEPGIFQGIARTYYNSNKIDLQYLYNPIYQACEGFLKPDRKKYKLLFTFALDGIHRLMETYSNCSILGLCLRYYHCIIDQYINQIENDKLFYRDTLSDLYTIETVKRLNQGWTEEKKKVVLDMIGFLSQDEKADSNMKSLETFIENNDRSCTEPFLLV